MRALERDTGLDDLKEKKMASKRAARMVDEMVLLKV